MTELMIVLFLPLIGGACMFALLYVIVIEVVRIFRGFRSAVQ